jgi:pimeloyl-ACP methyl ester carboxylesterase
VETRYARATDGTPIAYDVSGEGLPLVLLHGLWGSRQFWHDAGVVEQLRPLFRVIAVDLRGHGASGAPTDPAAYSVERHLLDLDAVADACGAAQFVLWGWSFGATIGTHAAARSDRLLRAVIAGSYFGPIFTEALFGPMIADWEAIDAAQQAGTLDVEALPPARRALLPGMNIPLNLARWRGMMAWPAVSPADVRHPILLVTGTADHALPAIAQQRAAIAAAGIPLIIFDGLDHTQLVTAIDTVIPRLLPFLQGQADTLSAGASS